MGKCACLAKGAFSKEHRLAALMCVGDVPMLDHAGQDLRQKG